MSLRLRRAVCAFGALALAAAGFVWVYRAFGFGIPCMFRALTGLYCPGCGTMRAAVALLGGSPALAVRYNPLLLVFAPVLLVLLCGEAWGYLTGRSTPRILKKAELPLCVALVALAIIFTVLRNLPFFSFLAPPA